MCPVLVSYLRSFGWDATSSPLSPYAITTTVPGRSLCVNCASGALGDEQHQTFDCPFVACVRAEYAHLFTPGCTILLQQHSQRGLLHSRMPADLPCLMSQVSLDLRV